MLKLTKILIMAVVIICAIIVVKDKPVYGVTYKGEVIGYVENKEEFEKDIDEIIINKKGENIAFVTLDEPVNYELKLLSTSQTTNENEILQKLEQGSKITYRTYAITLNGQNDQYVNSLEEAENIVEQIKDEYEKKLNFEIGILEIYTDDLNSLEIQDIEIAKTKIDEELEEKVKIEKSKINGVLLASVPVTGRVSSRYGDTEDRNSRTWGTGYCSSIRNRYICSW